jgi:predicted carbohydrate-binding protein with CBM5 and CBM33 domain
MLVHPRIAQVVAAGIAAPLLTVLAAGAAAAHGAPLFPISRATACGSEGTFTSTAACRAAKAGSGGAWFQQWDNLRVANVNGRDRTTIPSGKLCSGGLAGFGGLDLPRTDWPTTSLKAGKAITVRYRSTIPHAGTFRMYVTKTGYDPTERLRWSDLETKPFLTATDPKFDGKAYSFSGTLPRGKTGRHVIYTIWQNSSTADTYYSCSDVSFPKAAAPAVTKPTPVAEPTTKKPKPKPKPKPTIAAAPTPTETAISTPASETTTATAVNINTDLTGGRETEDAGFGKPVLALLGVLALAGTGGAAFLARRGRRRPGVETEA